MFLGAQGLTEKSEQNFSSKFSLPAFLSQVAIKWGSLLEIVPAAFNTLEISSTVKQITSANRHSSFAIKTSQKIRPNFFGKVFEKKSNRQRFEMHESSAQQLTGDFWGKSFFTQSDWSQRCTLK